MGLNDLTELLNQVLKELHNKIFYLFNWDIFLIYIIF